MGRSRSVALFGATTAVITGGLYWFGADPYLAIVAGLSWGVGLAATLHLGDQHPGFETGDSWRDVRWTQLGVGVTIVGFGGPLGLSLALGHQVGLVLLLGGVGFTAYVTGMLTVLDRVRGADADSSTAPGDAVPRSGD